MRKQIEHLKAAIQNKRSELARAIRSQSTQLIICEGEHDVLDRMQSINRREETVTFLNTLTRTLADVDAALMAIDEGFIRYLSRTWRADRLETASSHPLGVTLHTMPAGPRT
jgi:RNA polymerase-binding transcription factor DksA